MGQDQRTHTLEERRAIAQEFWDDSDTLFAEEPNSLNHRHRAAAGHVNRPNATVDDETRSAPADTPSAPPDPQPTMNGIHDALNQVRASIDEAWADGKDDLAKLANRVVGLQAALRQAEATSVVLVMQS